MSKAWEKFLKLCCKSQNHRLAEVESDLWRSYDSTTPSLRGDNPQFVTQDCVQRACVDSLASLGILFQHSVMLMMKKCSLNFRQCVNYPQNLLLACTAKIMSPSLCKLPSGVYIYWLIICSLSLLYTEQCKVLAFSVFPHGGQSVPLIIRVTTRNSLQSLSSRETHVSLVLMSSELDTVLQVCGFISFE